MGQFKGKKSEIWERASGSNGAAILDPSPEHFMELEDLEADVLEEKNARNELAARAVVHDFFHILLREAIKLAASRGITEPREIAALIIESTGGDAPDGYEDMLIKEIIIAINSIQ